MEVGGGKGSVLAAWESEGRIHWSRIGEVGGVVVITGWNSHDPLPDRWGFVPDGNEISARLTSLFDPAGVFRIGQLPGGL